MDDMDIQEIERRCNAATPAPWRSAIEGRDHDSGDSFIETTDDDIYLFGATMADYDFIAHARQDVPDLIEEIRRLRSLIK